MTSPPVPEGLRGLTTAEATARLATIGPNRIVARERLAWLKRLLALFADPMALMLGGASLLYFLLGKVSDGVIMAAALVPVLGVDVFLAARSHAASFVWSRRFANRTTFRFTPA